MKKSELANKIVLMTENIDTALISDFNRDVLENLKNTEFTGEVDPIAVETLEGLLQSFLDQTWAEEPLAHKYVVGSCLALTFLYEKPMHPKEIVHYIERTENGKERFYCPCHEENTICDYCVAVSIEGLMNN